MLLFCLCEFNAWPLLTIALYNLKNYRFFWDRLVHFLLNFSPSGILLIFVPWSLPVEWIKWRNPPCKNVRVYPPCFWLPLLIHFPCKAAVSLERNLVITIWITNLESREICFFLALPLKYSKQQQPLAQSP